jgi:hypothetical protein
VDFLLLDDKDEDIKDGLFFVILYKLRQFPRNARTNEDNVQVSGQACQGRSQSKGIGNAPIQAPAKADQQFKYSNWLKSWHSWPSMTLVKLSRSGPVFKKT